MTGSERIATLATALTGGIINSRRGKQQAEQAWPLICRWLAEADMAGYNRALKLAEDEMKERERRAELRGLQMRHTYHWTPCPKCERIVGLEAELRKES